jgi:hypothetical protein
MLSGDYMTPPATATAAGCVMTTPPPEKKRRVLPSVVGHWPQRQQQHLLFVSLLATPMT